MKYRIRELQHGHFAIERKRWYWWRWQEEQHFLFRAQTRDSAATRLGWLTLNNIWNH